MHCIGCILWIINGLKRTRGETDRQTDTDRERQRDKDRNRQTHIY